MKKIKIIHCADIHFDTAFHGLPSDKAEQRKEELRETFGRIVDLAKQEQVDLLLISGDLFDNLSVIKTTMDFIIKKFEEIYNIRVFIAPGNHDPYFNKSYYTMLEWPENVYIFSNNIEKVLIPELDTCIYGVGFIKQHEPISLIDGFSVEDPDLINLMVLHGEVVNPGQGSEYNPITIQQIENSKLDYLALGHRHAFSSINKALDTYWAYSGTPEGKGFDELGPKGIIIGELGKGYADLEFVELSKRVYYEKHIDISGCNTYEEIQQIIVNEINDNKKKENLYKIILKGEIEQGFCINPVILQNKIKNQFYYVKIIDNTKLKIDLGLLANEYSLLGIYVNKMNELLKLSTDEDEQKLYEEALKIGIKALMNEEVG